MRIPNLAAFLPDSLEEIWLSHDLGSDYHMYGWHSDPHSDGIVSKHNALDVLQNTWDEREASFPRLKTGIISTRGYPDIDYCFGDLVEPQGVYRRYKRIASQYPDGYQILVD